MLALDILLPIGIYVAILVAAMRSNSRRKSRVSLGAVLCLTAFVGSYVLRVAMTRSLPAAKFATYVPMLNLGRTLLMMAGIILIASAALGGTRVTSQPREEPDDNPYQYRD